MRIVAYTYEADHHCPTCAAKRFGPGVSKASPIDREGNPVRPVFSTDEGPDYKPCCGTCGDAIEGARWKGGAHA